MNYPIVKVNWVDACEEGECYISAIAKLKPFLVESVGFLVYEDSEIITVADRISSVDLREERDIEPLARHVLTIPQQLVLKVTVLSRGE